MPLTNSITHNTFLLHLHSINLLDSKKFHNFGVITKNTNIMKKTFYFTAIVLAFLLCSGQSVVCPPTGYDIYPDMEDCASYYECYNGILNHQACPARLLFNAETKTCADPASVDCQERPIPGEFGDYYYLRLTKNVDCQCLQPDGSYINKTGTVCIIDGDEKECGFLNQCYVTGYSFCRKIIKE